MAGIATISARNEHAGQSPFDACFNALGEVHSENVYDAIERLVQAGEQVGFSVRDLIRMLNDGMTLEVLLNLIEVRMMGTCVQSESRVA
jgi:hypothetical protein